MKIIVILLFILASMSACAQVEKVVSELPDYTIPDLGTVHTIKIDVTNNGNRCKQIYLRNDKDLTGIDFSPSCISDPISFLAEYDTMMVIDSQSLIPTPFGFWFKNMEPKTSFTFYFQSTKHIDVERLLGLIKVSKNDLSFKTKAMENLGWNADEIIIYIPLPIIMP